MCGITGLWTQTHSRDLIREEIKQAVTRLHHRGPDDNGIWINGSGVALGHTRLSILDLSAAGHQPMVSEDGRHVIVYNGEIYNFSDIKSRLSSLGHSFSGTGDTEVILHAFRQWGADAVRYFIGMFAIALWDEKDRRLELYRDRVGVKPLYYGWDGRNFCFASELKALRAFSHWDPRIDLTALGEFLQYGYVAGNRSIYAGVQKLRPGHRLVLEEGRAPLTEPYWDVLQALDHTPAGDDAQIEADLEALLIDSFRYRMVSDVPVGVFLSGGIDSSLLTALLTKHHDQEIRTFTIGFKENSHDESQWAKKIASHCGTNHTEYILEVDEAQKLVAGWGQLFDEPFGDSSGIPTLLVSRLASEHVKVVLSADGGDELFSGYRVYTHILERKRQLERFPKLLSAALSSSLSVAASLIPGSSSAIGRLASDHGFRPRTQNRLRRLASLLRDPSVGHLMETSLSFWQPAEIAQLIGSYRSPRTSANRYPDPAALQTSLWDFEHYLPEDILTKVDRTTMAVSIEGREPLLDHRLVEFAFNLPPRLRRGPLGPKHLLKKILYSYVPRELVDRPKQGFAIPLDSWLR